MLHHQIFLAEPLGCSCQCAVRDTVGTPWPGPLCLAELPSLAILLQARSPMIQATGTDWTCATLPSSPWQDPGLMLQVSSGKTCTAPQGATPDRVPMSHLNSLH